MGKDKNLAQVFHFDLYGKRDEKYSFLLNNTLQTVQWRELELIKPQYFFVQKDFSLKEEYEKGFSVQELFPVNSVGIVTARDNFTIHDTSQAIKSTINEFIKLDVETARKLFDLGKDTRDWSVTGAQKDLTFNPDFSKIVEINYRPFDKRFSYYTGNSKGFHCMPRGNVMQHFLKGKNVGLVTNRQIRTSHIAHSFVTKNITDLHIIETANACPYIFPLYLYPETDKLFSDEKRKPNLNKTIINEISQRIGLQFTDEPVGADLCVCPNKKNVCPDNEGEHTGSPLQFAPIDILDYIYAVLHSPTYRERYKEFLKIDFPRVPYPENAEQFWKLVELGGKLRRLHLLEGVEPQSDMADFPKSGSNEVEKPLFTRHSELVSESPANKGIAGNPESSSGRNDGRVFINDTQYFDKVPLAAWTFYIGGYQPAQKWLKDRKGRILNFDDILHYQRMIRVLKETEEIQKEIDNDNKKKL